MANEKKPSIYSDRGTIGSADELDEYGVWVKSEPQDLSSVNTESQNSEEILPEPEDLPDFGDITLPDMEDLPNFDVKAEIEDGDFTIPEMKDLSDFDSFAKEKNLPIAETDDAFDLLSDNTSEISDDLFDISDIDFDKGMEKSAGDRGDSDTLSLPHERPKTSDRVSKTGEVFTEVSMGDFLNKIPEDLNESEPPVDVKAGPVSPGEKEYQSPPAKAPEGKKSPELDLSTQLLMKIADELSSIKTEIFSLKQELSEIRLASPPTGEKETESGGLFSEGYDEKIALTGDELNNILNTANFIEEAGTDVTENAAEALPPEDEIETEPVEFSEELTGPPPEESPETAGPINDIDTEEDFSDTISFEDTLDLPLEDQTDLSVSEDLLPEESLYAPEPLPEEADTPPLEEEILEDEEIQPVESEGSDLNPPVFEETAEQAEPGDDFIDIDTDIDISDEPISTPLGFDYAPEELPVPADSPELRLLQEEGVTPMTEAPNDTSYLDEDLPAADNFDEAALDLSNAVIEEPDLSGDVVENPIQEPSPESISIDLDLEEPLELPEESTAEFSELPEESQEEISLDIAGEDFGPQEISLDTEEYQEAVEPDSPDTWDETVEASPEEEDFAQVVPEDLVVEADDTQVPFDNALALEEALPEESVLSAGEGEYPEEETPAQPLPDNLKDELKVVLSYMDQLLESLPEEKIEEFARSEYYNSYKKLFEELGLV